MKRNPLFFAFLLPALTDGLVTLLGQDSTYWSNYKSVNEASPAYFALSFHPLLFVIGALVWFIGLYFIFLKLKRPFSLILCCLFIAGHSWGSSSWIIKLLKNANILVPNQQPSAFLTWFILVMYYILIGVFAGISINQYINNLRKK